MRKPFEAGKIQLAILAILIFAFAWFTFHHLGRKPLVDFDEAIYAQVSSEALQNHTPLGFTWLGNAAFHRTEMWFEKPPLMIWLTESSYFIFGVNELAARFWPAVFAVLMLPLTFLFAKKLTQSFVAAIVSVAAFFTALQFGDFAGVLQLDIPVGFFVLLTLFSFWRAREDARFYFVFWAALGLGLMVKSVIGLLPLPVVLIYSALARDFHFVKSKTFWRASILFPAIVLPWHIVEHFRYGRDFWQQYLFYHLLQRYSSTLEENGGSFWFYLEILFKQQLLFWCLSLSLIYSVARSFKSKSHLFVTTAFLFIFFFFSAARTKLPPYILVIYPFAAVMIGTALGEFARFLEGLKTNSGNGFAAVAVLIFVIAGFERFQARLALENDPQLTSVKAVGEFLRTDVPGQHVYYYSLKEMKPSLIFYSNRTVYFYDFLHRPKPEEKFILISKVAPNYPYKTVLFSAATEAVYQIQ